MTTASTSPHQTNGAPAIGSAGWAWDVFLKSFAQWRVSRVGILTFLAGAVLVSILMGAFQLPGGVLPAIPVLTLPLVPHSFRMLAIRLLLISMVMVGSFLLFTTFQEQPWALFLIMIAAVYIGLYLVGKGMDMLCYLLAVAIPILLMWEAANGADLGPQIWAGYQQVVVGLLVTDLLGILFLQPRTEIELRKTLAEPLEQISKTLRLEPDAEPRDQPHVGVLRIGKIEQHLKRLRQEQRSSANCRNLHVVADVVRMVIGWNQTRKMLHELDFSPKDYAYLLPAAMKLRNLVADQLDENADAIRTRRTARTIPGISEAAENFEKRCIAGIETGHISSDLKMQSIPHAFTSLSKLIVNVISAMTTAIDHKWHTPPANIPLYNRQHLRDWSPLSVIWSSVTKPDPDIMIFAIKGVIVGIIGFCLASTFNYWGGAGVLLLMALLLAPQTMGSIASGYMLRMLGLVVAGIVCLLAVLVVLPDIDSPWTYALMLFVCLLPGAVSMHYPPTIALGLGYCMSVFFMLTQPDQPSIDLRPIQDRFISVGGATTIAWFVFLIIKPTYARDRIGTALQKGCTALAASFQLAGTRIGKALTTWQESEARWEAFQAIDMVNTTVNGCKSEITSHRERHLALTDVVGNLERIFVISRYEMRLRSVMDEIGADNPFSDRIDQVFHSYAQALNALGENAAQGTSSTQSVHAASNDLEQMFKDFENLDFPLNNRMKHLIFAQAAGLLLLDRLVNSTHKQLLIREAALANLRPMAVGAPVNPEAIFADGS